MLHDGVQKRELVGGMCIAVMGVEWKLHRGCNRNYRRSSMVEDNRCVGCVIGKLCKTRYKLTKHDDETLERKQMSRPAQDQNHTTCCFSWYLVPLLQYCAAMQIEAALAKIDRLFGKQCKSSKSMQPLKSIDRS